MRKMATVQLISDVEKHPNADSLDICTIGGWSCITKSGEFKKGDFVIFCEIDSFIPNSLAPFLSKGKEPRVYNGVAGEKLRTIRLRGELSQGLILPLEGNMFPTNIHGEVIDTPDPVPEGYDVTEILGIQKWEPPVNAQLAGQTRGSFPSCFPKTDQERIQNLHKKYKEWQDKNLTLYVQEKLEGSSMTCYLRNDEFGVASRNIDLKETEDNSFWRVAREQHIEEVMRKFYPNCDVAFQGELIGPGIQGNVYNLTRCEFRLFDIVLASNHEYMAPNRLETFALENNICFVPCIGAISCSDFTPADLLSMAEGKSQLFETEREGLVFKCLEDPSITFKAISNNYLLK